MKTQILRSAVSVRRTVISTSAILIFSGILALVPGVKAGEQDQAYQHEAMHMLGMMGETASADPQHPSAGPQLLSNMMERADQALQEVAPEGGYRDSAGAHAAMQGILLGASQGESVTAGGRCPANATVRSYDITAINVEISLNRFLQYYPGYMYVLTENVQKVREEEKRNKEARSKPNDPGVVSNGLQGDTIQPLVIRGNQGDCVVITLRNEVEDEDVSLHIHGSQMIVQKTGQPVIATNPDAVVPHDKSQVFEWYIRPDEQEGGHMFHTHVGREQTSQGLTGVFNVEPRGSRFLDPYTGKEMKSGWMAMIEDPNGPNFREFTVIYHEVGDESFKPLERNGEPIAQRDMLIDVYRPGSRALNYRSEPHGTRLALMKERHGFTDESQAYGSYMFGDPATPIPRSYLGDPAKWRLVHGGSEIIHSHHLHGGADRWPRQPFTNEQHFALASNGPIKFPSIRQTSDRVDVQTLGPSEVFDNVIECGSGGCQHLAGEFLYHCHVQQHYLSGMWAFWRVYDTLQAPGFQTDTMPPLQELPDRKGRMKPGVDSSKLIGTTVSWFGDTRFRITADKTNWDANPPEVSIKDWVEMMLPPQGQPGKAVDEKGQLMSHDATVLDWKWEGKTALNEPETTQVWVNYKSANPGKRLPFLFDPKTGKYAWPHLKPHLAKRPPFSPNHSGSPFLEPIHLTSDKKQRSTEPAQPGENGAWSLCPLNAPRKQYTIHGIMQPITLKKATTKSPAVVDPWGQLFVLHEEKEKVRSDPNYQRPLVIRMNVRDCTDVILKSEVPDAETNHFTSKINMHPHFFQFDTQATDGVITGMSYEQAVRPFTMLKEPEHKHEGTLPVPMNTLIAKPAEAGAMSIEVEDASKFHLNTEIGVGMDEVKTFEVKRIAAIKGNEITLTEPLKYDHRKGEFASVEFVRYRWYGDVDVGLVYWHDHNFGNWIHGFFGSTIVEPAMSTYHDPVTGKEIRSGNIADIHTTEPVSTQVTGSFREIVMHIQDTVIRTSNRITLDQDISKAPAGSGAVKFPDDIRPVAIPYLNGGEATTGSAYGMRAEPLNIRLLNNSDPSQLFSSKVHGDPDTWMLRAYLGDPIVVRTLVGSANEMHTWHITGHWFPMERYGEKAIPRNTIHISIAERYDLAIPAAGGPQRKPGDYPYYSGRASHFAEGSWGIFRVLDKPAKDLQPLPGRESIPEPAKDICPVDAPVKTFNVDAINHALRFNNKAPEVIEVDFGRKLQLANKDARIFVLEGEKSLVANGKLEPSPLTLHANVGDCIKINLKNETSDKVSIHADNLAYDPMDSLGINVGNNPGDQTVAPGKSRTYTFYAHPEYRENAALIQDWGDVLKGPRNGLYGAILIGPRGSVYRDPNTGEDISLKNSWKADVLVNTSLPENAGRSSYRDFALMFQDEDQILGTSFMPYLQKTAGIATVNYRSEPYSYREDEGCSLANMFRACKAGEESLPVTPTIQAQVGDPVRITVFGAFNEQPQVFSLEGHEWPLEPYMKGADLLSSFEFGGSETLIAWLNGGAGGPLRIPGDYLWMNHRMPYMQSGQWGYLRVLPAGDSRLLPLSQQTIKPKTAKSEEEPAAQPSAKPTSIPSH